jgi:protein-arginine kinase activator protein McsA
MKYIYITYDPLYEKIICAHSEPNTVCDECGPIIEERIKSHHTYQLEEFKQKIVYDLKTQRDSKISDILSENCTCHKCHIPYKDEYGWMCCGKCHGKIAKVN